jgi:hypothetical protein
MKPKKLLDLVVLKPNNIGHYQEGVALWNKNIKTFKCMKIEYGLEYCGGNDFKVKDQAGASKFMLMYYPELVCYVTYKYESSC